MSAPDASHTPPRAALGPLAGRGELVIAAVLVVLGVVLVWGNLTMDVVGDGGLLGPQGFGWLVAVLSFVAAALIAGGAVRRPARERAEIVADPTQEANLPALLGVLGGLVAFTALLDVLGWLIASTLLFFAVSTALGSRPLLRNAVFGFVMAAVLQLLFSAALGLALPSGILGGL